MRKAYMKWNKLADYLWGKKNIISSQMMGERRKE